MVRKRGFVHRYFFVTEESTLLFRIAKSFYATNSYTTYFLQMTKSLGKSKRWIDFPWCNIFEMRSERKCSVFDLLWPDPSILEGESEKFVFLENKNIFDEKKYTAFLVLLGSTCVQKLRQFEFLTLAIKISFLFDFCTDVFLNVTVLYYFVKFCRLDHFFPLMLQLLTDNF